MKVVIIQDTYCNGDRLETGSVVDAPTQDAIELLHARVAVPYKGEPIETAEAVTKPKRKRK